MELDTSLLQTNTNKIVFSTEPVATTSRSCNIIVPKEYLLSLQVYIYFLHISFIINL